jgi:hypothetical protein
MYLSAICRWICTCAINGERLYRPICARTMHTGERSKVSMERSEPSSSH